MQGMAFGIHVAIEMRGMWDVSEWNEKLFFFYFSQFICVLKYVCFRKKKHISNALIKIFFFLNEKSYTHSALQLVLKLVIFVTQTLLLPN